MYYYECSDCGSRYLSTVPTRVCSKCDGEVLNLVTGPA
jgi:Zn finger protein HypA/HybF involved in hydrogenase expression